MTENSMIIDRITANLPSRCFDATLAFYERLGFDAVYRDADWMILLRGALVLEFFAYADLDPHRSSFSACVRVVDVDGLYRAWTVASLPAEGIPRMTAVRDEAWGMRGFALVDLDGSLLRVMEPIE